MKLKLWKLWSFSLCSMILVGSHPALVAAKADDASSYGRIIQLSTKDRLALQGTEVHEQQVGAGGGLPTHKSISPFFADFENRGRWVAKTLCTDFKTKLAGYDGVEYFQLDDAGNGFGAIENDEDAGGASDGIISKNGSSESLFMAPFGFVRYSLDIGRHQAFIAGSQDVALVDLGAQKTIWTIPIADKYFRDKYFGGPNPVELSMSPSYVCLVSDDAHYGQKSFIISRSSGQIVGSYSGRAALDSGAESFCLATIAGPNKFRLKRYDFNPDLSLTWEKEVIFDFDVLNAMALEKVFEIDAIGSEGGLIVVGVGWIVHDPGMPRETFLQHLKDMREAHQNFSIAVVLKDDGNLRGYLPIEERLASGPTRRGNSKSVRWSADKRHFAVRTSRAWVGY